MKLDVSGYTWMEINEIGYKLIKFAEIGCNWLKLDEHGWNWMTLDQNGLKQMKFSKIVLIWMTVNNNLINERGDNFMTIGSRTDCMIE